MQIRPFRPTDAEPAFQLRVAAFSSATRADHDPDEIYVPDEHRIVAVDGDRIVGHLGVWPFAQAFGGRAVPMGGVAAVTVADHRRGTGLGSQLLAAALDHMGRAGMAISSLYPSTPVPYRRWGWEFAGVHVRRRVATRDLLDIAPPADEVPLRPYGPADLDRLVGIVDGAAGREHGGLVGGALWLARALQVDPDEPELALVALRSGGPAGLLLAVKSDPQDAHSSYGLHVLRLFGVDRDIERALWRFVGHHHAVAASTTLLSRPAEPLLFELPYGMYLPGPPTAHFMTRLVDAPAAIAARGWPAATVVVDLDIADRRRPANQGRFVLEVRDRAAQLTPGGAGRVHVDIGALASMYTGFVTPAQLAHAGRLPGATAGDIAGLTDAFAAPTPFLRDYF